MRRMKVYEVRKIIPGKRHETIWFYTDVKAAITRIHDGEQRDASLQVWEVILEWDHHTLVDESDCCLLLNRKDYAFNCERVL